MDSETRFKLLDTLLSKYLPPNAISALDQLPVLLQVFLAHHPDQQELVRRLPFCSPLRRLEHLVSGVWIGLPNRAL